MSEATELVVIEKASAMTVFRSADQVEAIIQKVEREVMSFVPDVTTAKGRKEIASLAYKVAQTKTYLDGLGKDLVAELKEIPKLIDTNRRTVRDRLDALKDKARQPLTQYEEEQDRLKKEEEERIAAEAYSKMRDEADRMNADFDVAKAEALKIKFEADHELALLMDKDIDRERADKAAEAERQRIAHEEEIKRQAAETAKREAEEKAAAELAAIKQREADAIAAKAQAELLAKQAEERAEQQRLEALEKAEREKLAAIEEERQKAVAAEAARLAEVKRIAEEEAQRIANTEHCRAINQRAVADLVKSGVPEDCAKKCVAAIAKSLVSNITIKY